MTPSLPLPFFQHYTRSKFKEKWAQLRSETTPTELDRIAQVAFFAIYRNSLTSWKALEGIAPESKTLLETHFPLFPALQNLSFKHQESTDGTTKFLWKLADGKEIESVIIPRESGGTVRYTACISSQVGCAMDCQFCLTGSQGLTRNLKTEEIIAQVAALRAFAPITNIVFMGMGEPLHNLENVCRAIEIFLDPMGFDFSYRRIMVSTSGLVPAITELGRRLPVSLAISLNASTDAQRDEIMPVNRKWNIATLLEACRAFPVRASRPITFEYVLLKGFNDTLDDADRISALLQGIRGKVNLIPLNEHFQTKYTRPSDPEIKAFQHRLIQNGTSATIRKSRGRDISAACGQLHHTLGEHRRKSLL